MLRHLLRHPLLLSAHCASEILVEDAPVNAGINSTKEPSTSHQYHSASLLDPSSSQPISSSEYRVDIPQKTKDDDLMIDELFHPDIPRNFRNSIFGVAPLGLNVEDQRKNNHILSKTAISYSRKNSVSSSDLPDTGTFNHAGVPSRGKYSIKFNLQSGPQSGLPQNIESVNQKHKLKVVLCTYRSCGAEFAKYTIDGTNICLYSTL